LQDIADALPHENPEKALETMIAWGRYAGIMDYNPNSKTVFVPHDEENATK
jgi:NitT/TauT family transport system ATP-binding protein